MRACPNMRGKEAVMTASGPSTGGAEAIPTPQQLSELLSRSQTYWSTILSVPDTPVGLTPKEVIWSRNKARLYHYLPASDTQFATPILIVYALINRPYILDLAPGASLVEFLVARGFNVYLIDWGVPGDEDRGMTFEDYVDVYLPRAVRKVLRDSGADGLTILGYCMGGTMSAMFAARHSDAPLRNLALMAAPIDFANAGHYSTWLAGETFDVDTLVDTLGNIPGEMIDFGNKLLKPLTNFVGPYTSLWERLSQRKDVSAWLTMSKWVNDGIPFPGEAFRQWVRDFYQANALVQGTLVLGGERVDLTRIRCPLLTIGAEQDHIVPCHQATAILDVVSSEDKQAIVIPAGHVSLVVGRGATTRLWPQLAGWLEARSGQRAPVAAATSS
jgi:polyhydroxyalkanoate synthase